LRETLQQDKELTNLNTSIGVVGPRGDSEKGGLNEQASFTLFTIATRRVYQGWGSVPNFRRREA
jgi:hypothetical protein